MVISRWSVRWLPPCHGGLKLTTCLVNQQGGQHAPRRLKSSNANPTGKAKPRLTPIREAGSEAVDRAGPTLASSRSAWPRRNRRHPPDPRHRGRRALSARPPPGCRSTRIHIRIRIRILMPPWRTIPWLWGWASTGTPASRTPTVQLLLPMASRLMTLNRRCLIVCSPMLLRTPLGPLPQRRRAVASSASSRRRLCPSECHNPWPACLGLLRDR